MISDVMILREKCYLFTWIDCTK